MRNFSGFMFNAVIGLGLLMGGTQSASASGGGFGSYFCFQSSAEPKVVYVASSLSGKWGIAARVTSTSKIEESELVKIAGMVDALMDNEEEPGAEEILERDGSIQRGRFTVESVNVPAGYSGYFQNAKYRMDVGMNNQVEFWTLYAPNKSALTLLYKIEEGGTVFKRNGDKLGPATTVEGYAPAPYGVKPTLTQRACGYWHDS